jgi:hypothetical protein
MGADAFVVASEALMGRDGLRTGRPAGAEDWRWRGWDCDEGSEKAECFLLSQSRIKAEGQPTRPGRLDAGSEPKLELDAVLLDGTMVGGSTRPALAMMLFQ